MSQLSEWFNLEGMKRPQTVSYTLPRMALTMKDPMHREAFKDVCHGFAAKKLQNKITRGEIEPEDFDQIYIRLLGKKNLGGAKDFVMHTVIVSLEEEASVIIDDMLGDGNFQGSYDADGVYRSKLDAQSTQPRIALETIYEISLTDFMRDYYDKIKLPEPGRAQSPNSKI